MNERARKLESVLDQISSTSEVNPAERMKAMNDVAWELRHTDSPRARRLSHEVEHILESCSNPVEQTRCRATLAEIYSRQGNYREALQLATEALESIDQLGLEYLRPHLWSAVGGVHWLLGDLAEALHAFQQQHSAARELQDTTCEAEALNNIALIHSDSEDPERATESYNQALAIYESLGDLSGQALVLNNLGMTLYVAGDYPAAMKMAVSALEMAREVENQTTELTVLDTIGLVCMKAHDHDGALDYFQQTFDLATAMGMTAPRGIALLRIGQVHVCQDKCGAALEYLRGAQEILEPIEQRADLSECHLLLSQALEGEDEHQSALEHFKQFHDLREQVFNMKVEQRLKDLQTRHEIERMKQESEIQRVRNTELQAAIDRVKQLSGLLPICSGCKKIRDDDGRWQEIAVYIRDRSEAEFSHGLCPDCAQRLYPEYGPH